MKKTNKMPYVVSRKRPNARKYGKKPARNWLKSRASTSARSTRSFTYKGNGSRRPFGYNLGDSLHIDYPIGAKGAFPNTLYTQLRYSEPLELINANISGLTGSEVAYRMNSLYDPNFTAALNHQPLGFDQLAAVYRKYCVYKVDVQVKINRCSPQPETNPFIVCGARACNSAYVLGNKQGWEVQEQPFLTVMDGQILQSWNHTYWIGEVDGRSTKEVLTNTEYSSLVSTNPTQTPYFAIACGDWQNNTSSIVDVTVSFVFHARFFERQPLAYS